MSNNPQNPYSVSIPADWTLPKFNLNQPVQVRTLRPDATRIQSGTIVGIEYLSSRCYWVTNYGLKTGWYYSIEVETNDPWYFMDPFLHVAESDISDRDRPLEKD